MADESVWTPQVQRKDHPFGEQGVITSLEAVAERVALGATSPKVRMWAIECLDRARKERGWKMDTEKERAIVLLEACQAKLWVPDPVGVEWMAGAHLMACDPEKDGVCFRGNDCDDLVILLGSCFSSVGLYTSIVGHAYDREKNISHVLTSVWVNGRWMYADPSTDLPLGECVKFTRERVYSVPNIKMICDSNVCFTHPTRFNPDMNDYVGEGGFVGVSGPPKKLDGVPNFAWLSAPRRDVQWLGSIEQAGRQEASARLSAQCNAISSTCAQRVCRQIVQKQGGTSEDDLRSYTATAAACGAEAACTYFGVPPGPATQMCGRIGELVGQVFFEGAKFVISKIGRLFGRRNNKAKKFKRRVEFVNEAFTEFASWIEDIYQDQEEATQLLHDLIDETLTLYNRSSPVHNLTKIDLAMKLQQFGLPITTRWRPLLGFSVGITNGGSVFSGMPTFRDQSRADQLNGRYDMIMSPEWDSDLGVYVGNRLDWDQLKSRDAKRRVEDEYENIANKYNEIHDQILAWLAQLEVTGAMLTAYVTQAAAENAAGAAIQEEIDRVNIIPGAVNMGVWPRCKTVADAGIAYNCLRDTTLPECNGAPRNFFEYVDALPYCDSVTQAEKDLLALAEAMASQDTKKKKKSSALPVVVFAAAAAGLAWWAL